MEDERKEYEQTIRKLDEFFTVRKNVIFERARFSRRNQGDGETAQQYITPLYCLIETCEYNALADKMLRIRIVVGIHDQTLFERLQTDASLTLEKAKQAVRQRKQ